jgi:hypothetical protein
MNDDRIDELIALAALGELTPDEERELDQTLADDVSITIELDADLRTAAAIQRIAAETPPPELRQSVLDAIAHVAQESPGHEGEGPETPAPHEVTAPLAAPDGTATPETRLVTTSPTATTPTATTATPETTPVTSLGEARTRRSLRVWQPLLAAAAVVGLVVAGVTLTNRTDAGPTFASVTQAEDARVRPMSGILEGELTVVYSPAANAFVLDGRNIPLLTAEQTYELWFVDAAGSRPIALFRPDKSGRVMETFEDLDPSDVVIGVTIEPASGSDTPTLPIIATA